MLGESDPIALGSLASGQTELRLPFWLIDGWLECDVRGAESAKAMAKIGTERRPITVRVQSEERGRYVAETCAQHEWHYIIGLEPDEPEDISDLERALNPGQPVAKSTKAGRNDPCPCGSGKKHKKCCGATGPLSA